MFTKEQVLKVKEVENTRCDFLNIDGIKFDTCGIALAEFLGNLGFDILEYGNMSDNGLVTFADDDNNIYTMSTNGRCRAINVPKK